MSIFSPFREHRPFPGQDPWVVPYDGQFLLVQASNGKRRIVVKRFKGLERMGRNTEKVIWAPTGPGRHLREVWAPELHQIDGRCFVYFAAGDGRPGSHRTYALTADDPLGPYEWLGPVCDPDHDVWAIDLTVYRQHVLQNPSLVPQVATEHGGELVEHHHLVLGQHDEVGAGSGDVPNDWQDRWQVRHQ